MHQAGDIAARIGSLRPADPRVRKGLYAVIGLLVALSVAFAIVALAGDLPDVDWNVHPWAVALAIGSLLALLLCSAGIWRRLLGALGPKLEPRRSRAIWFTSALGRYVPTGLLLPVLRIAMSEREGAPKRICLASVVYELALSLTAGVAVAAYFVIDLPSLQDEPARWLVIAVPVLALAVLHPRVFHSVADMGLERLGRAPLPLSLPFGRVLEFSALYCGTYVLGGLGLYGIAACVYPVGADDLVVVLGAFAVGNVVSFVAPVLPGGLIAREAGVAVALAPVMPASPALTVAVLSRIIYLALETVLAIVTPILARRRP
jgi:hypothetical protein